VVSGRPLAVDAKATPEAVLSRYMQSRGRGVDVVASLVTQSKGAGAHGITHLRMTQKVEGLDVYRAYVRAAVNAKGELTQVIDASVRVGPAAASQIDSQTALSCRACEALSVGPHLTGSRHGSR